ncbi:hypothetical protein [Denitrobaculum tricleocarpae]|uniref:Uncharacterized protein n=1 Tax=Denitrobaculum tricleocarpae TaxID=2591009 RepID=A0A545TU78_9PROT|nr:hypothetical protein [Denitrobaculum tricleocarpae]TQV80773.1 hypothetical protein FKG95_11520 [Denitrobaculum tricleocarpae]
MTSPVEICNRALDKLGSAAITSLDDNVKSARACARMFDAVRDAELRDHQWNFATARASLPELEEVPVYGFARQYQLPGDCLKVVEVEPTADWKIEGRRLLTNVSAPVRIKYIRRVGDTSSFDALFVETLAARMAQELCETLTQSNSKKRVAQDDYAQAVRRARRADAIEGTADALEETSWIKARF